MLGSSVHLWSYKDGDAKWPLSQGKSLEGLTAQTPAPHPLSRTRDAGGATSLCKSPFSRHQACPCLAWGTHREGMGCAGQRMLPCSHNQPHGRSASQAGPSTSIPSFLQAPASPSTLERSPKLLAPWHRSTVHSSTTGRQQESSGQLGTPRAGEKGLCPLLYPSARHRYSEPPPNLTASTHPSHHLLSLRGGGGGGGEDPGEQ